MKKRTIWIIASLVVLVVALLGLKKAGIIGKEEGIKITAEKVAKRTIIETVNASGKVYPEVEVKVSSDISGEILELTVAEGDSVTKGQVLARIFADLIANQRDQAAAGVQQQQALAANSQQQLAAQKATLNQAQANYNRQMKLLNDKVISKSEFEQAESQYLSAKANYQALEQSIRSAQAGVASAQANLKRTAADVNRATIVAPMSGRISYLGVEKGEKVVGTAQMAGTEMMRIADMSTIEVRVDVGENDIPKVHIGDSAIVEVDAYTNRKFKGLVTRIASSSNTTQGAAAASTNDVTNYKVYIRLLRSSYDDLISKDGKTFAFRPGMTASADIQTRREVDVLSVPINAVTTREKGSEKTMEDKKNEAKKEETGIQSNDNANAISDELEEVVFVLTADGKVKKKLVKTGVQDINYIQILSGLDANDEVITGPYNVVSKTLKESSKVKKVEKDKLYDDKKK